MMTQINQTDDNFPLPTTNILALASIYGSA